MTLLQILKDVARLRSEIPDHNPYKRLQDDKGNWVVISKQSVAIIGKELDFSGYCDNNCHDEPQAGYKVKEYGSLDEYKNRNNIPALNDGILTTAPDSMVRGDPTFQRSWGWETGEDGEPLIP